MKNKRGCEYKQTTGRRECKERKVDKKENKRLLEKELK